MYINCFESQKKNQFVYTTCSELGIFMYWTCNSMNNLLSYCGLVDARISASKKIYLYEGNIRFWFWYVLQSNSNHSIWQKPVLLNDKNLLKGYDNENGWCKKKQWQYYNAFEYWPSPRCKRCHFKGSMNTVVEFRTKQAYYLKLVS